MLLISVEYANTQLGTQVILDEVNVVYQGTFDDKATGQQIAAQMYDRGVKVIFTIANDGVGLPADNPNLSEKTIGIVNKVYQQVKNKEIIVNESL